MPAGAVAGGEAVAVETRSASCLSDFFLLKLLLVCCLALHLLLPDATAKNFSNQIKRSKQKCFSSLLTTPLSCLLTPPHAIAQQVARTRQQLG